MGRTPYTENVEFVFNGKTEIRKIEFFTWEKTDFVDDIRKSFGLK
jgi:S-adenosylmethionine synthetase